MADLIAYTDLQTYLGVTFTAGETTVATYACGAASDAIRTATGRTFQTQDAVATTRYFTPYRSLDLGAFSSFPWNPGAWGFVPYFFYPVPTSPSRIVPIDDLFLVNQVIGDLVFKNHATQAVLTLDRLWPFNAGARGEPYTAALFAPGTLLPDGEGSIDLLAKFDWPALPSTIINAALIQASRYFKRKDAPFGVAGNDAMGNAMRLRAELDPDVALMVANARRIWAAA